MEYKILRVNTDMRSQFQYLFSPATITLNQVFMQSARHFCPILTKSEIYQKNFMKVPNIKFHRNPSSRSRVDTRGQMERRKAANRFSRKEHLWRYTQWQQQIYLDLNAKCLKLLQDFNQIWIFCDRFL